MRKTLSVVFVLVSWMAAACTLLHSAAPDETHRDDGVVDFNRDIRPILSDTCFKCHGPDASHRKADLRLDIKENVFDEMEVVVPGDIEASELIHRIIAIDETRMPPLDSGRVLTQIQKDLLKRWVEQGAKWSNHWSFEPPLKSTIPAAAMESWGNNPIDYFISRRLQESDLTPSKEADRQTLCRRVYLDLTGLPPTPAQMETFLNDSEPDAYEKLVDRLLSSPRYGEHMTRYWLDAARYGDTHGLHLDNYREMWLYRDWVVDAFNTNKSYRDFVIEQLAGDLLENPTQDQIIATGFNRAHVTTNEGGSIDEEIYVRNVVDRVSTTGTVFMGLTVGCAVCHDHKFDPIAQKEFYQLFAFFNNLDGNAMDGNSKDHAPVARIPSQEQSALITKLNADLAAVASEIDIHLNQFVYDEPPQPPQAVAAQPKEIIWVDDQLPAGAKPGGTWTFVSKDKHLPVSGELSSSETNAGFTQHFFTGAAQPLQVGEGDKLFAYVFLDPQNPPEQIMLQWNDGQWEHRVYWGANKINFGADKTPARKFMGVLPKTGEWIRLEIGAAEVNLNPGSQINGLAFSQWGGRVFWDKAGIVTRTPQVAVANSLAQWTDTGLKSKGAGLPDPIKNIFAIEREKWTAEQTLQIRKHYLENVNSECAAQLAPIKQRQAELKKQLDTVNAQVPLTLIWKERKEIRPAYLLKRGQYDQHGEVVSRETPAALPPFPADAPRDRMGLAMWLVSDEHPLTARVAVNRFWQQLFGTGIVATSEDFGSQGEMPSHPELLDWLAMEFRNSGWDVKAMMKRMVMSATYRQSSNVTPELLEVDPNNRLLARGPRFRLDAESLRDQALFVAGLMNETIGGPSVKPPQPDGLWFVVGYSGSNTVRFKKDSGAEKVHRRSLYTFWKRTAPPPQMSIADAPSRESCSVRRERTNTPLLALMLMNDPQYVEAARHLAQLAIDDGGATDVDRIRFVVSRALTRTATPVEIELLENTLKANRAEFKNKPNAAGELVAIGESPADKKYDVVELASWTLVASLIMNTDEFVTKN